MLQQEGGGWLIDKNTFSRFVLPIGRAIVYRNNLTPPPQLFVFHGDKFERYQ